MGIIFYPSLGVWRGEIIYLIVIKHGFKNTKKLIVTENTLNALNPSLNQYLTEHKITIFFLDLDLNRILGFASELQSVPVEYRTMYLTYL